MRAPERVQSLDILRGLALLGMILVHVHQHLELPSSGLEDAIPWIIWVGVEQKSWATFALLFGVGFAVQLRRMEAKDLPVTSLYLRRLLVLALFGLPAHALFGYRILLDYAFWGVPLLFMRRWSTRALLLAALVSVTAFSLIEISSGTREWLTLGRQGADAADSARGAAPNPTAVALQAAENQPSYPVLVQARLRAIRAEYLRPSFLIPNVNLALFIFGFLALRKGFFDSPRRHVRTIASIMAGGFLSWALWWLVLREMDTSFVPQRIGHQLQNGLGIIREQWLAFTHVGGVVLLLAYRPEWGRRLSLFG
ncbi:MAG TPA: heparan-alpha-glucosaminide N-acetyltransferase domain-containing protein, partial [Gemmatimonadales bacterium]